MNVNNNYNTVFKLSSELIENYQVIHIEGKLIYGNTQAAKKELVENIRSCNGYILNLDKVEYIDSTGLGAIMNFAKTITKDNKKMILVIQDTFIKEILSISKFDMIFYIVPTIEKALKDFKEGFKTELELNAY